MNRDAQTTAAGAEPARRREVAGICAVLVVLVLVVFGQTFRHGFVNFDDDKYIYENPIISEGITLENIAWAFTHVHAANWHPLTTLSHMLDCQFYGLWAGGHHLSNVLLHAVAAVLLFLVLREMTGALWRSAFVAAVFAIHPLRVESVAWVAERKDVLSGVFFMLTLWAYSRYVRRPESRGRYTLVAVGFVLGLMSKPMLVTVPFVLLLLDFWPLGRLQQKSQLPRLLWEKLPLFALLVLSCVATVIAQGGAIQPLQRFPLPLRIGNALVAYGIYLRQMIYPAKLVVLYPMLKDGWPMWVALAVLLLLMALTAGAWILRGKKPYLIVGWLWYIGMLVPVIGILQVGHQAHADRYTYLPQIGIYLAATWAFASWAGDCRQRRMALGGLAVAVLSILLATAHHQTSYWRDSIRLWTHAFECVPNNPVAHYNLGHVLQQQGRTEEAITQFREALRLNSAYTDALCNLGLALSQQGRTGEAIACYREALRVDRNDPKALTSLPAYAVAHCNLGIALFQQGQTEEAITQFREALQVSPDHADAHNNLGNALLFAEGKTEEAIAHYRQALRINPAHVGAHFNLANVLIRQGRTEEAMAHYREALRLNPAYAEAHYQLGSALFKQGRTEDAIAHMRQALELEPANGSIQNDLAWILATAPQESLRAGARAGQLATHASHASGGNNPLILETLAAAYAEAGDFPNAVQTTKKALQLAETQPNAALAAALRRELQLYEAGQAFHESP